MIGRPHESLPPAAAATHAARAVSAFLSCEERTMSNNRRTHWIIHAGLATLMAVTRLPFCGGLLHLADASWAVFFLAGFYLGSQWRSVFPLLMIEAVGIDYLAIRYMGTSNYCVTLAYWFLVPSYATLWLGGHWLRRHASLDLKGLLALATSLTIAVSLCYLISNASFYWIGDRIAARSWDGWTANFVEWY
jgi:hypothetical protein